MALEAESINSASCITHRSPITRQKRISRPAPRSSRVFQRNLRIPTGWKRRKWRFCRGPRLERGDNALLAANAAPISDEKRYRLSDFSQRGEIDALVEAVDELRARPIDERRHIAVEAEEARIRRRR
jgi:hypothetical protein